MQLNGAPGSDAQAPFGVETGKTVQTPPLALVQHTAGNTQAHHELVSRFQAALAAIGAAVAVVLLIDAMELHQQRVFPGHRASEQIVEPLGDGAAQMAAAGFQLFVLMQSFHRLTEIGTGIAHHGLLNTGCGADACPGPVASRRRLPGAGPERFSSCSPGRSIDPCRHTGRDARLVRSNWPDDRSG